MGMDITLKMRKDDEKRAKMIKTKEACEDAGVTVPGEVDDYLEDGDLEIPEVATEFINDHGLEETIIDLKKLPENTRYIILRKSW